MPNSFHGSTSSYSDNFPVSRFTFLNEAGETKISYSFHNVYCPEIMRNFKDFLLGCGFLESTVVEAMYEVIEEYESLHPRKDDGKSSSID
jgi:hypothetical protein